MDFWTLAAGAGGWPLGFWQSHQERKRGIEEGAQAAFSGFQHAMPDPIDERDQQRLKEIFKDDDRTVHKPVRETALATGKIYAEIIRREAFRDARSSNFSPEDREAWEAAYGEEMPPVGYQQGYLAAIRDVVKGASEIASEMLSLDDAIRFEVWAKRNRTAGFSWIDGRSVGRDLMVLPFDPSRSKSG